MSKIRNSPRSIAEKSHAARRRASGLTRRDFLRATSVLASGAAVGSLASGGQAAGKALPSERKVAPFEMYVTTPQYDPIRYEFGVMIAENWRKLGFEVKVTALDFARMSQQCIQSKNYDTFTLAWAGRAERIDPDHYCYQSMHSSQVNFGQYNIPGYQNPEYDKWAELQRRTLDPKKRREAVWKCQEIAAHDQPYIPICSRRQRMPYNDRDWGNWTAMMGEGLNTFWNFMRITPKTNRKVLRFGFPNDVMAMNPMATSMATDIQVLRLIYDRLMQINPQGVPEKWAAEEIREINDTTIEVKIRAGMTFHDGKPVTAEDIKFSFEYPTKVKSGYFMGLVEPIADIKVLDDRTVVFKLKRPFAPFLANCLGHVFILPKHIWERIPESAGLKRAQDFPNEKPIASGPFKVAYWRRTEELKMDRFESHFAKPKIEGILYIPYANVQSLFAGVQADECDLGGWWLEAVQAEQFKAVKHVKIIDVRDHGYYFMNLNMRRKPFDDVAVRRALAYATPKQEIVERLLEGHGEVNHSIVAPASEFWHNPTIEKFEYSLDQARKTLSAAGYEWNEKGLIHYPAQKKS